MTDEKKKPEEDEVTDEQLDDVAGGTLASLADAAAQAAFLKDTSTAEPVVSTTQDAIARLADMIKDLSDTQKTTFDSTNTTR